MITTPRRRFGFLIKSQLNRPPKNASDHFCSCGLARLLPRRAKQSQPDFSNFLFESRRRKFQQPEERQIVTAAEESFQRNNGAGPAFTHPNSSKQSKVMKDQSGFLHQDNCWQLSELACAVSVYHFSLFLINMQTLNFSEGSLNNPRLYFAQSPLVNLQKLTSLVESSKQTQLLPKPPETRAWRFAPPRCVLW